MVLDGQPCFRQPVPFKREPFPVRMENPVEGLEAFLSVQHLSRGPDHLKQVQHIRLNTGQPCFRCFQGIRLNGEGQVFFLYQTVVATGELVSEHGGIFLSDTVEIVSLVADLNALFKILPAYILADKGELHAH